MRTAGVIVAAGRGVRVGGRVPKQFLKLGEKELWEYSLDVILSTKVVDIVAVVVPETWINHVEERLSRLKCEFIVLKGGERRQDSVYNALRKLRLHLSDSDIVILHDAARPLVSGEDILNCVKGAEEFEAATLAVKAVDTMVNVAGGVLKGIVPREELYHIQTPQCFRFGIIYEAHKTSFRKKVTYTDDATMVAIELGRSVKVVDGNRLNIKVTTLEDLILVRKILGV